MSDSAAEAAAAAAAQAAALRSFNTELWTLYAFGVVITALRTYARVLAVGFRGLRPDDYIVWLAIIIYSTQSTLAFYAVNYAGGLANNSMTDEERAALSTDSLEFHNRVVGSQIQVAGWTSYVCLICALKMAMLVFYIRLTDRLGRAFLIRIYAGFGLVALTFVASLGVIYGACQPLSKYWQINPDPGNACQGAVALPIVWVTFSSSVVTDIYLIMIPLPMLWGTTLKLPKKIASTIVLGAGIFVLVCSTLKTIFVIIDPINGAQAAGEWGTREAFVSVVITNLPMIFPLIRIWLRPIFGSALSSNNTPYKGPSGFRTIGGSEVDGRSTNRRTGPASAKHGVATSVSFSESEERIINNNDVKMQTLAVSAAPSSSQHPAKGIVVSSAFHITEDRASQIGEPAPQRGRDAW